MYKYSKLWVYQGQCVLSSLEEVEPFEKIIGRIDGRANIWDYAHFLENSRCEVFQVVNPNSEHDIELYLRRK